MIRIVLFSENGMEAVEAGSVEFQTLLVQQDADYRCSPEGILTRNEIEEISRALRQLPQVNMGRVGKLRWVLRE